MSAVDGGANKDEKRLEVLCRMCGIPLLTKAEQKIGVHISCVNSQRFHRVNIPRPIYGNRS